jgi:tetratricopeptide (TPR) repeat protein
MQAGMEMQVKLENWKNAANEANNLSELRLTIGDVAQAVTAGRQSVELAEKSGDAFERMSDRTTLADALHQAGELAESHALFAEAEQIQQERLPEFGRLYGLGGFQYCDLLLKSGVWQEVHERAEKSLQWAEQYFGLLANALDKLSLGRAAVQEAIAQAGLSAVSGLAPDLACVQPPGRAAEPVSRAVDPISSMLQPIRRVVEPISGMVEAYLRAVEWLNQAVDGLREAGYEYYLPLGLLARAACCRWAAHFAAAEQDLQDCEDIAQRGGMQLHLIDCHLEAARLALATGQPVLARTASEHLAAAQEGIAKTGYKRRRAEAEEIAAMV